MFHFLKLMIIDGLCYCVNSPNSLACPYLCWHHFSRGVGWFKRDHGITRSALNEKWQSMGSNSSCSCSFANKWWPQSNLMASLKFIYLIGKISAEVKGKIDEPTKGEPRENVLLWPSPQTSCLTHCLGYTSMQSVTSTL